MYAETHYRVSINAKNKGKKKRKGKEIDGSWLWILLPTILTHNLFRVCFLPQGFVIVTLAQC